MSSPVPQLASSFIATASTFMSHLAMLEAAPDGSDPTTWLEPLPDDEYQRATQG